MQAQTDLAEDGAALLERLLREGRAEADVDVSACCSADDGSAVTVARASFCWHLQLQPA
jgi:hypothetical protein